MHREHSIVVENAAIIHWNMADIFQFGDMGFLQHKWLTQTQPAKFLESCKLKTITISLRGLTGIMEVNFYSDNISHRNLCMCQAQWLTEQFAWQ